MARALNSSERRTFRAARYAALRSLEFTINHLNGGNADVARVWMGVQQPGNLQVLAQHLNRIFQALQNIHEGQVNCEPNANWYAEAHPNDAGHHITLGGAFFTAPTYGNDSRAGTLIHETSHFNDVLGTDDHAYGQEACLRLVQQAEQGDGNLHTVLTNADNWEYLVEHTY